MQFSFDARKAARDLNRKTLKWAQLATRAAHDAAVQAANEILAKGRRNIANAGRFGRRWLQGLHADIAEVQGGKAWEVRVTHDVPYFMVFQKGKVIRGKPLLWIPLSWTDAVGVRAKDYPEPLFRVDRAGGKAPLLLTFEGEPVYFGKKSVKMPKKFRIIEIVREVAKKLAKYYNQRFKLMNKG